MRFRVCVSEQSSEPAEILSPPHFRSHQRPCRDQEREGDHLCFHVGSLTLRFVINVGAVGRNT